MSVLVVRVGVIRVFDFFVGFSYEGGDVFMIFIFGG